MREGSLGSGKGRRVRVGGGRTLALLQVEGGDNG